MAARAPDAVDSERFKDGMRWLAESVCIVTTKVGALRFGMTVTAFCSVSAQPPSLLVCVNKDADSHDLILKTRGFCVNVLADSHVDLAVSFSGQDGSKGEERFRRGAWMSLVTGAPVLRDSLASFDCQVFAAHEAGSHTVFLGTVVGVRTRPDLKVRPLVYADRGFCSMAGERLERRA